MVESQVRSCTAGNARNKSSNKDRHNVAHEYLKHAEYVPPICIMLLNSFIVSEIYSHPFLKILYLAGVLMCNLLHALPVGFGENRDKSL